jgi:endonuclease YncB( thermonuclease family)
MWLSLLATACVSASAGGPPPGGWPTPPSTGQVDPAAAHEGVYDGDTFTLTTGDRVRLKWVNTPEMKPLEPWAQEAREFTKSFVTGKPLTLTYDPRDPRDSYGRVVAGVRTPEGDLSEALLRAGLAHVFLIPPETIDVTRLLAIQDEARAAHRGIWSSEAYQGELHFTSFHANGQGDDVADPNVEYMRIANMTSHPIDVDGWRLVDRVGHTHRLPAVTIPAGYTAQVHSGVGPSGPDADGQVVIHLGSTTPLWDDKLETVELYDPAGHLVDKREHKVGK